MSEAYLGEIRMFGGSFTIQDWIPCDGRLLHIAEYEALYFLIGTAYGGDGQTTFAVPDMRGRVPVHMGTTPANITYTRGVRGGAETVTLTLNNLPPHSHTISVSTQAATSSAPSSSSYLGATTSTILYSNSATSTVPLQSNAVTATGAGHPFEISMPYLPINFLICAIGIFPSQS